MAKKKRSRKGRRPAKKTPPTARELKVWLAALFLLVFLVGSLSLLQMLRQSLTPVPPMAKAPVSEPVKPPPAQRPQPIIAMPPAPVEEPPAAPQPAPEDAPEPPAPAAPVPPASPEPLIAAPPGTFRVAIIVDDLGQDLQAARTLLGLDLDLTFAVLPNLAHSARTAELAHRAGREVIVHIPMEPVDFPRKNPGANALMDDLAEDEIRRRLQSHLAQVPHAVGGNNHMGSRFTRNRDGMQVVMEELAERGLFFVDSLTSGSSVAAATAEQFGVPRAVRDLFLDNEQDVGKIRHELQRLIRLAQKNGSAVAICHPYPQTLEALRLEKASFARAGVEVVRVSRLLRRG
ncbi:divergent polysaccharide deacetylase family protein [Geoalkalibacter sp.]|uniref:divergent polysaccharide deacetylase family protein n=1 Tax=Geoalkalibacter sp. TaxID=3041440 RepID=UPI00272E63CC|nr:divergent polysaccharide deacetylase family protein [Geoalkalibacter sp.]